MELTKEQKQAVRDFHNSVYDCPCGRVISGEYCKKCKKKVINFIDEWGLGILCQDITTENLGKENDNLKKENVALSKKLKEKIKRVEELKNDRQKRN